MRSNYWSCTKFADWIRGTKKPNSGTAAEWREWETFSKNTSKLRHWIAEEGLDKLQKFIFYIPDRINDVRYYINNRFFVKSHALTAHPRDIKPGQWCDVGNRFVPCLFNELVDFVEIEKAWMHVAWDDDAKKTFNVPWWRKQWYTRWFGPWRCKEAGIAHLQWEMSLTYSDDWIDKADPLYGKPTPQAVAAKEVYDLYKWWTEVYANRPDPIEASGWSALCETMRSDGLIGMLDDMSNVTQDDRVKSLNKIDEIEAAYEEEDEQMLIRLIRIRNSLWT